jgi:hypothetical protein
MLTVPESIFDLQRRYATDWRVQAPTWENIVCWAEDLGLAEDTLYDDIAAELALGYHIGRYSFEFCDAVVNRLYTLMLASQQEAQLRLWPKLFWRVFEAFDAGELANPSSPAHDPVKAYTDPEIADIVRELRRSPSVRRMEVSTDVARN